jgi:hypothetical protein
MALETASSLFLDRTVAISPLDIVYAIECLLQSELASGSIICRGRNSGSALDIRVGTAALAQAVELRAEDIRAFAQEEFGCAIRDIRVML